jgi:hypothetical protein
MQNDVMKATMLTTRESSDGTCGGKTYAPMKIKKQKESSKSITIPFLETRGCSSFSTDMKFRM